MFRWETWGFLPGEPNPFWSNTMELSIKRNKNDMTRLLVSIPYSLRVGLRQASDTTKLSQQALIRAAIAAYLHGLDSPFGDPAPEPEPEYLPHKIRVAPETKPAVKRTRKATGKATSKATGKAKKGGA